MTNSGPDAAAGAVVIDDFPAALLDVSWTCEGSGGATCTASGTGDINETVNLPAGGTLVYEATGTVDPAFTGAIENTATVTAAGFGGDAAASASAPAVAALLAEIPLAGTLGLTLLMIALAVAGTIMVRRS